MVGAVSAIGLVYLATAVWLHQKKQGITNLCIYHVTWAAFFLGNHFQHLNTFALCERSKKIVSAACSMGAAVLWERDDDEDLRWAGT